MYKEEASRKKKRPDLRLIAVKTQEVNKVCGTGWLRTVVSNSGLDPELAHLPGTQDLMEC